MVNFLLNVIFRLMVVVVPAAIIFNRLPVQWQDLWWTDLIILFTLICIYDFAIWFFRIRFYIVVDGIERGVIKGGVRK